MALEKIYTLKLQNSFNYFILYMWVAPRFFLLPSLPFALIFSPSIISQAFPASSSFYLSHSCRQTILLFFLLLLPLIYFHF